MNSPALPSPYLNLSVVLRALRGEVGGWTVRMLLSEVLALLLYRRLGEKLEFLEKQRMRGRKGWSRRSRLRMVLKVPGFSCAKVPGPNCAMPPDRRPSRLRRGLFPTFCRAV